jgi:arylsulfatase
MALCWPKGIEARGELRTQFHHVIDIAPTIFELAGIEPPTHVNGIEQAPLEGVSMAYTFDQPEAKSTHTTQYFEIMANRGIYHEGWMASCFHGRVPWVRTMDPPVFGEQEVWELYHIEKDFSQADDLAATHPEKLKELLEVFDREAWKYNVYPLGAAASMRGLPPVYRPSLLEGTKTFTYYADTLRLPEYACVNVKNVSFEITAKLVIPNRGAEGVIVCQGGHFGGWSLYVANNRPVYVHNWFGHEMYTVASETPLPAGEIELKLVFDYDGGGMGLGGDATILVNGARAAKGRIAKTVPVAFSQAGETFDVGVDTGSPVGDYHHEFAFTGEIKRVDIAVGSMGEGFTEEQKAQFAEMYANAIAASQ